MPKIKIGYSYAKKYDENDVINAIEAIKNKGMSCRQAEKLYNIPRATIRFRISEAFVKVTPGPSPVLSDSGEKDLVDWITEC